MKIFVVEDEAILAQTLIALLGREGYQASWADCLELCNASPGLEATRAGYPS